MAERPSYEVRIAFAASDDIAAIWSWTVGRFGQAAALRYERLIEQALGDLGEDPERTGSKLRSDLLPGLWLYHLASSRDHVPSNQAVKTPRTS